MNVIIFGGSGFIGTHYRNYLDSILEDANILHFDIDATNNVSFLDVRIKIEIPGDFSDKDVIINLAAIHRTPGHPDYEYFETNIKGAENVCAFAERVGICNIIFTSSIAPYGASEEVKTESTLPTPNTPYGISKLVSEEIHKRWVEKDLKRRLMILRPGVVFGKGENGNFTRLASAIAKRFFFYPGRRNTIKASIYVKELVYQSWELFQKQESQIDIYNFAYQPPYTIEDIVEKICSTTNNPKPKIVIPAFALKIVAMIFKVLGLSKLGIHPERVKKLMTSTNISGQKLRNAIPDYKYSMDEALEDWFHDCDQRGLF